MRRKESVVCEPPERISESDFDVPSRGVREKRGWQAVVDGKYYLNNCRYRIDNYYTYYYYYYSSLEYTERQNLIFIVQSRSTLMKFDEVSNRH